MVQMDAVAEAGGRGGARSDFFLLLLFISKTLAQALSAFNILARVDFLLDAVVGEPYGHSLDEYAIEYSIDLL